MIVHVQYDRNKTFEDEEMQAVVQLIECERLYKMESKTHWGFLAYDEDDNLIAQHKFSFKERVKAYIMENGKTVDTLPRR